MNETQEKTAAPNPGEIATQKAEALVSLVVAEATKKNAHYALMLAAYKVGDGPGVVLSNECVGDVRHIAQGLGALLGTMDDRVRDIVRATEDLVRAQQAAMQGKPN